MPSKDHLNGHVLTLQVTTFKFDKHFTEFEIKDSGFTMEDHKFQLFLGPLAYFFGPTFSESVREGGYPEASELQKLTVWD